MSCASKYYSHEYIEMVRLANKMMCLLRRFHLCYITHSLNKFTEKFQEDASIIKIIPMACFYSEYFHKCDLILTSQETFQLGNYSQCYFYGWRRTLSNSLTGLKLNDNQVRMRSLAWEILLIFTKHIN